MATQEGSGGGGKLASGVRLSLFWPKWDRSCVACKEWQHDKDTGRIVRDGKGKPLPRGNAPTPCLSCPKVPEWAKADGERTEDELRAFASDISDQNLKAWTAYKQFRATGQFPDDAVVRWYSGIIRDIEDAWQRSQSERMATTLESLTMLGLALVRR